MKSLKLWQKAGLVAAIVSGLTLGGLTPKYSSKGLESKLPTIGMSITEAKTTNPDGYGVPDLTGYTCIAKKYLDGDNDGVKETFYEVFKKEGEGFITRYSINGRTFAWGKLKSPEDPNRYAIRDSDCDGTFEEKYSAGEEFEIPECAK